MMDSKSAFVSPSQSIIVIIIIIITVIIIIIIIAISLLIRHLYDFQLGFWIFSAKQGSRYSSMDVATRMTNETRPFRS